MESLKLFLLALFIMVSSVSADTHIPYTSCPIIKYPPKIDGNIVEPVWQQAHASTPLVSIDGSQIKTGPKTQYLMYTDGKNLYIAVIAYDPDTKKLKLTKGKRDDIAWDETIEIFIAPRLGDSFYYHFAFTPGGGIFDNVNTSSPADYNFDFKYAVKIDEGKWTLEFAIPLSGLDMSGLVDGSEFDINVARSTENGRFEHRHQTWGPVGTTFHNRNGFGRAVFGSFSKSLKDAVENLKGFDAKLVVCQKNPSLVANARKIQKQITLLNKEAKNVKTIEQYQDFIGKYQALNKAASQILMPQDSLLVCRENPWKLPDEDVLRDISCQLRQIELCAMQGEYLDFAISVTNPTNRRIRVRCVPENFFNVVKQIDMPFEKVVTVYRVTPLLIQGNVIQRDALVEVGIEHAIDLIPGQNEILWFSINTNELPAGIWNSQISLLPLIKRDYKFTFDVELRVLPCKLGMKGKPYSCNWANYNSLATRDLFASFKDQKNYGTNVHIINTKDIGLLSLKFDKDGKPANEPDFSALNRYLDFFGSENQLYLLQLKYDGNLPRELAGSGNLTPEAKVNFKWFFEKLISNLKSKGVGKKQIAWYTVDEPDMPRARQSIILDKLILEVDPEQQIFTTIYNSTPMDVIEELCPYVNVWAPSFNSRSEQIKLVKDKAKRKPIRFLSYQVLGRTASPITYRIAGFQALRLGYEGVGFWCYDDAGPGSMTSTWNDFERKQSDYAVVYEGSHQSQPSVRWQAWRQNLQSYRYAKWLDELAANTSDKGLKKKVKNIVDESIKVALSRGNIEKVDAQTDKMRNLAARLIVATEPGKGDEILRILNSSPIYCLTGNGLNIPNYHTDGSYEYNIYPTGKHSERCGVLSGEIYFNGADAKTTPQATNKLNGTLTDIKRDWPNTWIYWNGGEEKIWTITFDLKRKYLLAAASMDIDYFPGIRIYESISVYTSNDKVTWKLVEKIDMQPINKVHRTVDEQLLISLQNLRAQYVKFEIETTKGSTHLGEIRIYGCK